MNFKGPWKVFGVLKKQGLEKLLDEIRYQLKSFSIESKNFCNKHQKRERAIQNHDNP